MITELPMVPFVIINLTSLTAGVCMKVIFKSKVTSGFSFSQLRDSHSPLRGSLTRGKIQEKPLGPGYQIVDSSGRYIVVKAAMKDKMYVFVNIYAPNKDEDTIKFFKKCVN